MPDNLHHTPTPDAPPEAYGPPGDFFIVEPGCRWAQTHADSYTAAVRKLGRYLIDDPLRFIGSRIVHADQFAAEVDNHYLDQPLLEITADEFDEMLNVLPPRDWVRERGFERFNCREMTNGWITRSFARAGERHFSKYVRQGDPATYITPATVAAAFPPVAQ